MADTETRRIDVKSGTERDVSVDRISQELGRLWGDISQEVEQHTGELPLRTSILTLVIIAEGKTQIRIAHETLHELVEQLPSRVIVVEVHGPGTGLDASVAGHCRLLGDSRTTCYEVIEIHTSPERLIAVPSMLSPLELHDIPAFMWCVGEVDFTSPAFLKLTASAERIIIDSSRFDSALNALVSYASFLKNIDTTCSGTDLTWAKTNAWRELIAQAFDHPATLKLLTSIQSVDMSFDPSAETQALLLVGWLASRLGWSWEQSHREGSTLTMSMRKPDGTDVTATLNRQASTGVGLRAIRILASSGDETLRVTARRQSADLLVTSREWPVTPRQDRVSRVLPPRQSDLIGQELLIHQRDQLFHDALDFAAMAVR
jgi:glucose-6-phosphate dehydrogenase assembly protein OpcA